MGKPPDAGMGTVGEPPGAGCLASPWVLGGGEGAVVPWVCLGV